MQSTSEMMNMSKNSGIAIVGGGPGGLLLARMLYLKGVAFTVYERDESPVHRGQGGMLDLHPGTGQYAMKRAGLFAEFQHFARYEDQGTRLYDKHGLLVYKDDASDGDRPEIDRSQLRDLLLRSIPADSVRWGCRLTEALGCDDGTFELHFGNGSVARHDFVVGADGVGSRVRALVSNEKPRHIGLTLYELAIDGADARHPDIAALVGHGTMIAKGDGKSIFAQRNANAHIRVYAALRGKEKPGFEATKESLAAQFAGWDGSLLQLIESAKDTVRPWPICALPVGHCWQSRAGVTLIGDAAHVMPPAGEGGNLALRDAADLADALTGDEDRNTAVRAYEATMWERAATAASNAMQAMDDGFAEDSLEATMKRISGTA